LAGFGSDGLIGGSTNDAGVGDLGVADDASFQNQFWRDRYLRLLVSGLPSW
jgi:hypothetical protein